MTRQPEDRLAGRFLPDMAAALSSSLCAGGCLSGSPEESDGPVPRRRRRFRRSGRQEL